MARLGLLLALCACDVAPNPEHKPVLPIPLQVVVSDSSIAVYMDGADLRDCTCEPLAFPALGTCSFITDANPCNGNRVCDSCITEFGVEVDGAPVAVGTNGATDPRTITRDTPFPPGALALVIGGCERATIRIPLDGAPFGTPTATADYVGTNMPHVSWTTDVAAASTLVTLYGGTHGDLCHVAGASEYTFADWMFGSYAIVQPLTSRVDIPTDFGPATVWRGDAVSATFPSP